jgi:hypothetical protein
MRRSRVARFSGASIVCALVIFSGAPVTANATPKKPVQKITKTVTKTPVAKAVSKPGSGAWRPCVIKARLARLNNLSMRKLEVWVRVQNYVHVTQKAECSGPGPIPKIRAEQPAEVGGGVYVSAFSHFKDENGEEGTTSYYKTSTGNSSATNPDLRVNSVSFGSDEHGIWASLSLDARVRGVDKSFGQRLVTSSDPQGFSVKKMEPYSVEGGGLVWVEMASEKIRTDLGGGNGVDGFGFNGEFRAGPAPELGVGDGFQAMAGDFFGAANTVQPNGYASVSMNRQYFVVNNADAVKTLDVHFAVWVENDGSPAPKNLPPLEPDPKTLVPPTA